MGRVFISYRREDSAGHSGRIRDRLIDHFGGDTVFIDVDGIAAGEDFVSAIEQAIGTVETVLVVIGRGWMTAVDQDGNRRLDAEGDLVRAEVTAALRRDGETRVIPVLVGGAAMPDAADLPVPIKELATRHAVEVRDASFDDDVDRLVEAIGGRRRLRLPNRVVMGAALVSVAVAVALMWLTSDRAVVPTMDGDFNVAVAGFAADGGDPNLASSLTTWVYDRLVDEIVPLGGEKFVFRVWGPPEGVGGIAGDREERAEAAAELANDIAADLVVYGVVEADGFTPEFYLADRLRHFEGAEELTGQHELGTGLATGTLTSNDAARTAIAGRAEALAQFVIGLSYYIDGDFSTASDRFVAAEQVGGWEAGQGREVLYLFQGNAWGKQGDYDAAQRAFDTGIAENADYARLWLGRGEVQFQRARSDCEKGNADRRGLEDALTSFDRALMAPVQPAASHVPAKAALGRARTYTCLSQALIANAWEKAEAEYRRVVEAYEESGDERLAELAAEAYAGLGFISFPFEGDASQADGFCAAQGWYETAQLTTGSDDRRQAFQQQIDFADQRLAELGASC